MTALAHSPAPAASERPPGRAVGRPSLFTPAICQAVITHIADALPARDACVLAGVSYQTFREWMIAGEAGDPKFSEFSEAIHRAEVTAKQKHLANIAEQSERDWKASGWILSHRWPEDYATQSAVRVQHSGTVAHVHVAVAQLDLGAVAGLLGLSEEETIDAEAHTIE